MKTIKQALIFAATISCLSTTASAGFLDKLSENLDKVGKEVGKITGNSLSGNKQAAESGTVTGTESGDILGAFIISAISINEAQILQAKAFGLKEEAQELELLAESLSGDADKGQDEIEKITETSNRANLAIQEKINEGEKLSEEGRAHYVKSLLPYSVGLAGLRHVVTNSANIEDDVRSKNWLKTVSGASTTMYLTKTAPGYFNNLYKTSSLLMTYAKNNNIQISSDAAEQLGSL